MTPDPIGLEDGINLWPYVDSVGKPFDTNLYTYTGDNPVNWIDPLGLAGERPIEKGSYRFIKYVGDLYHGGEHWHVYLRRTGELLGRINPEGKVLTGEVPIKAIKILTKLGKIGGVALAVFLELADPATAGGPEDMLQFELSKCH